MSELTPTNEQLKACADTIKDSIKDFVEKSGVKGAVLGLSGGIDSACVASLACDVVNLRVLIMPDKVTLPADVADARELSKKLGVDYSEINLGDMLDVVGDSFPWDEFHGEKKILAEGNLKARLRMVLLYMAANYSGRVVLGTGNKTETLLGYCTKYGDAGVDYLPLGGLYKTQVMQIGKYLALPESIQNKPPSAGLWAGQTDEAELGMDYQTMDEILHRMHDLNWSADKVVDESGIKEKRVRKLVERMEKNRHKRGLPETVDLSKILNK